VDGLLFFCVGKNQGAEGTFMGRSIMRVRKFEFATRIGELVMNRSASFSLPLILLAVVACADQVTRPSSVASPAARQSRNAGPVDPTDTWKIPLADGGLALRSDHAYSDGTYSVYASGVCNVSGQTSNSGDATIQTSNPTKGKCGRRFTIVYPDGFNETLASFNNLNMLENTTYSIPVGTTVMRRLVVNPGVLANNPSRCGKLYFGVGPLGEKGIGSDSVAVTRIDAGTWQVESQTAPNDRALCETNGQLYEMPVSFVVVSGYPLP
jgi:hypothetical protein